MQVRRQIVINPVEPVDLSMRVPASLNVAVLLSFVKQDLAPVDADVNGVLCLTSRSTGIMQQYPAVSTDVTNGKAEVVIPADTLDDNNGYRVRLFAEIDGRRVLAALGLLRPIPGAVPLP